MVYEWRGMAGIADYHSLSEPVADSHFSSTSDQFWPQHDRPSRGHKVSVVSESERHEAGWGKLQLGKRDPKLGAPVQDNLKQTLVLEIGYFEFNSFQSGLKLKEV